MNFAAAQSAFQAAALASASSTEHTRCHRITVTENWFEKEGEHLRQRNCTRIPFKFRELLQLIWAEYRQWLIRLLGQHLQAK